MPKFSTKEELDFHIQSDRQEDMAGIVPVGHGNKWKILAEGDSWFKYPKRFFGAGDNSNIIQWLSDDPELYIESDAENGDEILEIFSGEKKNRILKKIRDAFRSNNYYDILLLSGGGNDIVGAYDFDWLIRENPGKTDAESFLRRDNLLRKINRIEDCYSEMIERATELDHDLRIISHEYDYAIPNPVGYKLFDWLPIGESWMHPFLANKNITDKNLQALIVKEIFYAFSAMQQRLADKYQNYTVVKTAGTLLPDDWRNEIHPTPAGFSKISRKFINPIKSKLPRP